VPKPRCDSRIWDSRYKGRRLGGGERCVKGWVEVVHTSQALGVRLVNRVVFVISQRGSGQVVRWEGEGEEGGGV